MLNSSGTLVAVRRRNGPNLSRVSAGPQEAPNSATLVLQMLVGELASVKQKLNALVVARPSSLQQAEPLGQKSDSVPSERVRPEQLRKIFD